MERQELFAWAKETFGTEPDYPWDDWNCVLRHKHNNKWYALIAEISERKVQFCCNQGYLRFPEIYGMMYISIHPSPTLYQPWDNPQECTFGVDSIPQESTYTAKEKEQ